MVTRSERSTSKRYDGRGVRTKKMLPQSTIVVSNLQGENGGKVKKILSKERARPCVGANGLMEGVCT